MKSEFLSSSGAPVTKEHRYPIKINPKISNHRELLIDWDDQKSMFTSYNRKFSARAISTDKHNRSMMSVTPAVDKLMNSTA